MSELFDPKTLADDLTEARAVYARFFAGVRQSDWDKPVHGSPKEWDLHETVAHLCALNGAGLESIKSALAGRPYTFIGLDDRYHFNTYNRKGIDDHMAIQMQTLCGNALGILDEAARIAQSLRPEQAETMIQMPIYNRPVSIAEALSILIFHTGLAHSAQVAEPAGRAPLWMDFSSEFRHRVIGRTIRCFSLLYRLDLGGSLRNTIVFRIDGPEGGEWYVRMSPDAPGSGEGRVPRPGLVIHLREAPVFYHMLTSRFSLPLALLRGDMKLSGDLRLFLRMGGLFSIDTRPRAPRRDRPVAATQGA